MFDKMETTAPIPSAGTDGGQSSIHHCNASIANCDADSKRAADFVDLLRSLEQSADPSGRSIVSMRELQEQYFESRPAIIDQLLPMGTFLFTSAPKIGKSWLMLQIAYNVSRGLPLWGYATRQGEVLYLSLEDNHASSAKTPHAYVPGGG